MEDVYEKFINVFVGVKDFNEDIWFNKSWNTFSRTLKLNHEQKIKLRVFKNNLSKEVFNHLEIFKSDYSTIEIEDWYKSFITRKDGFLTLGQRQKLLNILIKYFVINEHFNYSIKKRFTNSLMFLHIPIDRIILNRFGMIYDTDIVLNGKLNNSSWSKMNNYDDYLNFQNIIKTKSKELSLTPLEFEMKFLWISEKELIKFYFESKIINLKL